MLRQEVIEAAREWQFHIYPVRTIDAGITIVTGVEAGECGDDGAYEAGTVNRAEDDYLAEFAPA